jgi:ribosomal protein S18 acetylase RimI-like enzyme
VVDIRRATPADYPRVADITAAAYAAYTSGPDDPYLDRLRDSAGRDRDAELWVAHMDGVVAGSVTLVPSGSPWRELAGPGEAEFRMLAVDPAAQGSGVGGALVALVVQRALADGDRAIVLSSLVAMTTAHRVYRRHGFRRTPDRDWSPVPGVELIAFRRDLIDEDGLS